MYSVLYILYRERKFLLSGGVYSGRNIRGNHSLPPFRWLLFVMIYRFQIRNREKIHGMKQIGAKTAGIDD
ncbi:hypothetical protein [Sinobaca sp. H24]|uniref:hypothetical protein n=1 Tax=Sinobaca sp. H24 TaxID=2923376 RepID=UPI00207A4387|nr:hypothetical protein [Sinobaca sp. H24]